MGATETARPGTREIDPITFSVILNRFQNIANEMTLTLEQSAWTSILALARDFSCALYDAQPRQIAMLDALPIHTTSLHIVLAEIATTFDNQIEDGDVFACNDPFRGNTHIGDLVTAAPVFVDDDHLFWAVTKGHQMDTGAFVPSSVTASARNVWQEGLTIPPLKLYERGVRRDDVIDLYLSNMRYRDLLEGDLLAQLGSIERGRERLLEVCREYGREETKRYVDAIIDYADRRMSDEVESMPDGVYESEGWIDSDGVDRVDIPIKVKITVEGDSVSVDYTGSGEQASGGMNGSFATSQAAPGVPFMYYIDPDIPHNHGCIKHIASFAPEGTICNAKYPASTSVATIVPSDMMHDVVNKAMASAIPERVSAGGPRCANIPQFSGIDDATDEAWGAMLFNNGGGQGASLGTDGWPLLQNLAGFGGLKSLSVEQIELLYPMFIEMMEIEPDSMGAGASIGGPGTRLVVHPSGGDMECVTFGDGCRNPPHGILGGTPGIGGGQFIDDPATGKRVFVSASGNVRVLRNQSWVGVSTGGGGYGSPLERDAEQVRRNVRDGIISRSRAREIFGVVVSDDFDPVMDEAATTDVRHSLAEISRPLVEPMEPAASRWLDENMREGDEYLLNPL